MEDPIESILLDQGSDGVLKRSKDSTILTVSSGVLLAGLYWVWTLFSVPGSRKIPKRLTVPYLPSSKEQTQNVMRLLEGRRGRLADLGSGDGRLVFAACSAGFQCTGYEINFMLLAYSRGKARWKGLHNKQATFVNKDFWKTDLSQYNNVTLFLGSGVTELLGEKLLKELPDDARVIACRSPLSRWPHHSSLGSGLDQTWAYDISTVRSSLGSV